MNKPTPKIYRTSNWKAYNQALINRGNISIWFDENTPWYAPPQGKQRRDQTYSDTAIQCCLMIKSLFRLSLLMVFPRNFINFLNVTRFFSSKLVIQNSLIVDTLFQSIVLELYLLLVDQLIFCLKNTVLKLPNQHSFQHAEVF